MARRALGPARASWEAEEGAGLPGPRPSHNSFVQTTSARFRTARAARADFFINHPWRSADASRGAAAGARGVQTGLSALLG